jgi:hypothetical protein
VAVAVTVKVELYIESQTTDDVFILDDATKGKLDDATYVLGGGPGRFGFPTDITDQCHQVSTSRGRSRLLDTIQAGTCQVMLRNYDREFDPPFDGVATSTFGPIRPGKRITVSDGSTVVFDGVVEDWNHGWSADKSVEASLVAVDALGMLGRRMFVDEWVATEDEQPGERFDAILDRAGWPIDDRDFDTGVSFLQGDTVPSSNVLEYAQRVAATDVGRLFASRTGDVTFRDRHDPPKASVAEAFGTGGVEVAGIDILYGSEELFTQVTVSRVGGVAETVTSDDTVITEFELRSLEQSGLLLRSDQDSRALAVHLLATYEEPSPAVSALTVILDRLGASDRATVAGLEIGDIVTLDWTPTGSGTAVSQELIVEGISYSSIVAGVTTVTLDTTQITDRHRFILDDSSYGVLDEDILAY